MSYDDNDHDKQQEAYVLGAWNWIMIIHAELNFAKGSVLIQFIAHKNEEEKQSARNNHSDDKNKVSL
jgi:hypothetical protein